MLISSCAAPGIMGRLMYGTLKQLKAVSNLIGADPVGVVFTGLVAGEPRQVLSTNTQKKLGRLAKKLLRAGH